LARIAEEQHGGEVRINVPSLTDEPIPVREALNTWADLQIAADRLERQPPSVGCWSCKQKIEVGANRGKRVACPACGTVQAMPS